MTENIHTDPETGQRFYTDPETGGRKQEKTAQLGALDPQALLLLAEHAGKGALKYDRLNYLRGYPWHLSFDAAQRHLLAFWNGEDTDAESGSLHVIAAAWHCLALASYVTRELGTDTRFKQSNGEELQIIPDWVWDAAKLPTGSRVNHLTRGRGTVDHQIPGWVNVEIDGFGPIYCRPDKLRPVSE